MKGTWSGRFVCHRCSAMFEGQWTEPPTCYFDSTLLQPLEVVHAMFGQDGVLPCCGVHRSEAPGTDRVSITPEVTVTCDGKKRYRDKESPDAPAGNRAARRARQRR